MASEDRFAAANKAHFDQPLPAGTSFSQIVPGIDVVQKRTIEEILQLYPFDRESTTVLDFACGNGDIAALLSPHVYSIIGVDISQGMVDRFNETASTRNIDMKAFCGDILDASQVPEALSEKAFDVIICCLAYHHFTDLSAMTMRLISYLKPGGALIISEFLKYPLSTTSHAHIIPHEDPSVFEESQMRKLLTECGLKDIVFSQRMDVNLYHNDCVIMVTRCLKPL
ncbi:S-adenosyl-L-methionine-dependent methyltransferase [Flagelloscypha sp. PMI_526]|nr:S-adenosyl-L-methionine-dependent methyltransferase [Flagelloscypha sp. PMI_526]